MSLGRSFLSDSRCWICRVCCSSALASVALILSACEHTTKMSTPRESLVNAPRIATGVPTSVSIAFAQLLLARAPVLTDPSSAKFSEDEFVLAATVAVYSLDSDFRRWILERSSGKLANTPEAVEALEDILAELGNTVGPAGGPSPAAPSSTARILCAASVSIKYRTYLQHLNDQGVPKDAACNRQIELRPPALYWFRAQDNSGKIVGEKTMDCTSGCTVTF